MGDLKTIEDWYDHFACGTAISYVYCEYGDLVDAWRPACKEMIETGLMIAEWQLTGSGKLRVMLRLATAREIANG